MEYHHIPYGKKTKNAGTDRANKKGQNKKMKNSRKNKKVLAAPFAVAAVFAVAFVGNIITSNMAMADSYDDQINALKLQNGSLQNNADAARNSSISRQEQIDQLQGQVNLMQGQINDSNEKIAELNAKIAETEKQIKTQGAALSGSLQNIYYSSQSNSTLNILMNSNSISDYVDAQSRQTNMQQQMQKTIDNITAMKKSIEMQKAQIQSRLEDQKDQQNQISTSQAQIAVLKAEDDAAYNANIAKIGSNNNSINNLTKQQAAQRNADNQYANQGGDDDYPFANAPGFYPAGCISVNLTYGGNYSSNSCARQCVSYVQWRILKLGQTPQKGDAGTWSVNGTTPRANSVAIWGGGTWGHVAWVESVNGDGTINIAQYNASFNGKFSRKTVNPRGYLGLSFLGYQYH